MTFCKHIPLKTHTIFEPRWHDRKVLMATYNVTEHNKVIFPKAKSLEGAYYIAGKIAKKFKQESNGSIMCYAIPLDKFESLTITERCEHEI